MRGSLWTDRRVSDLIYCCTVISMENNDALLYFLQMRWAHRQVQKAYAQFVHEFDRLRPQDVIWTPYTAEAVQRRAPYGLSSLCTRDEAYWLTKVVLVGKIDVEPYCVE